MTARPRPPRRAAAALLAALALPAAGLVAGCASSPSTGAGASCVGPQPTVAPAVGAPGEQLVLSVEWLHSGCRDTVPSDEVEKPLLDVPVEVVQGGRRAVVGTVSGTGEHFGGALRFALPAWLRPGPADLVLDTPIAVRLPLTVLPPP